MLEFYQVKSGLLQLTSSHFNKKYCNVLTLQDLVQRDFVTALDLMLKIIGGFFRNIIKVS